MEFDANVEFWKDVVIEGPSNGMYVCVTLLLWCSQWTSHADPLYPSDEDVGSNDFRISGKVDVEINPKNELMRVETEATFEENVRVARKSKYTFKTTKTTKTTKTSKVRNTSGG